MKGGRREEERGRERREKGGKGGGRKGEEGVRREERQGSKKGVRREERQGRKEGGETEGSKKGGTSINITLHIVVMSTLASHSSSSPPSPSSPKHTLLTAVQSLKLRKTSLAQTCTCHPYQLVQHKISPVQLR